MSELDIYSRQTFGQKLGFGRKPAFLIIDFQFGFTSEEGLGGYNINSAIENTEKALAAARENGILVAHAQFISAPGGDDLTTFGLKVPRLREVTSDSKAGQIVPGLTPRAGEYHTTKRHASAFFGTNLSSWLAYKGVDTLFIAGCTTSGCVRGSVVDASAYGLRPMVIAECVGDRAQGPHEANMFDMQQKYADIVPLQEAIAHFQSHRVSAG